jgi:hypothetical protein
MRSGGANSVFPPYRHNPYQVISIIPIIINGTISADGGAGTDGTGSIIAVH